MAAPPELPRPEPAENGGVLITRRPVPQSAVTFGQAGPKRDDPDWYAARLVNDVLGGGGFRGRLMQEIREKRGLAYGGSTELVSFRHAGLILGSVATENARVAQSIALIRADGSACATKARARPNSIDAKDYLIGSFPLTLDTERADRLGAGRDPVRKARHRLPRPPGGAVRRGTLDQARRVAHRLIDPDKLSFAVVGDPADLTPTRIVPDPGF